MQTDILRFAEEMEAMAMNSFCCSTAERLCGNMWHREADLDDGLGPEVQPLRTLGASLRAGIALV